MPLNPNRLGPAIAAAAGLFYLGCVSIMAIAGRATLVAFFDGLFHGLDLSPILMEHVSVWITLTGFINTIVLSWLFGALIAVVYNLTGSIGGGKGQ